MPTYDTNQMIWASAMALAAVVDVIFGLLCFVAAMSQLGAKELVTSNLVILGAILCTAGLLYLVVYIFLQVLHLRRHLQTS